MTFTDNHPNNRNFGLILLSVILTIAVGAIVALSGCKSAEKKQAKMYGKFDKLKRKADADSVLKVVPPKWSLDNFPVTVGKGKTVYLPSKKVITHDTVTKISQVNDTVYLTKIITKHSHSVDTLHTTDTLLDNRPLTQLQTDLRQVNDKLIQSTEREKQAVETKNKQRNKLLWSIGVNLFFVLLIIAYFLRKVGIIR